MADVVLRLRERKLVQWALAYAAGAFALRPGRPRASCRNFHSSCARWACLTSGAGSGLPIDAASKQRAYMSVSSS